VRIARTGAGHGEAADGSAQPRERLDIRLSETGGESPPATRTVRRLPTDRL